MYIFAFFSTSKLQKREISDKGGGVSVSGVTKRKGDLVIIRDEA